VRRAEGGRIWTVAGGQSCGYAGDGGPATSAELLRPYDVALDRAGNLYVADLRTFTVRKVDAGGTISTVAGVGISRPIDNGGSDPTGGLLCSVHKLPVPVPSYLNDGGPADEAGLYFPYAIALGHEGHLYIADTFDHRVRRVTCGGSVPCAGPAVVSEPDRDLPSHDADSGPAPLQLPATGHLDRQRAPSSGPVAAAAIGGGLLLVAASVIRRAVRGRRKERG
jgi:hypothetical protein